MTASAIMRAGFGADDVHAQHLVGRLVGQHLHEALGRAVGAAARIGGEGILADLVGNARGLELFLGLADPADLGLGVDDRGHEVPVHVALLAGDGLDAGDAVLARLVGEHRPVDHVADRVDAGHRRSGNAHRPRCGRAASASRRALSRPRPSTSGRRPMQTSTMSASSVSAAPPFAGSTVSVTPASAVSALVTLVPSLNFSPCLASDALELLGDLVVDARRDAVEELDHRHVRAEPTPHRAELEADDAGADHDQALGHLGELERAGRGDDLLLVDRDAGQRRHFRARGDQDVLGRQRVLDRAVVAQHRDRARLVDAAGALERGDLVLPEQEGDALGRWRRPPRPCAS